MVIIAALFPPALAQKSGFCCHFDPFSSFIRASDQGMLALFASLLNAIHPQLCARHL